LPGGGHGSLNEEVEQEEKRADTEKDSAAVNLTSRNALEAPKKSARNQLEPRFFAQTRRAALYRMSHHAAAKRSEFIVCPDGNFLAMPPQKDCAGNKNQITQDGENTESGSCTPKHGSSQEANTR